MSEELGRGVGSRWESFKVEDGMTVRDLLTTLMKFPLRATVHPHMNLSIAVKVNEGRAVAHGEGKMDGGSQEGNETPRH